MSPPFRSDSLDNLVSTDDLDQASSLIRFRSFLFLFVFVILIGIGVVCAIFVKVPIKVSGPAVLWSDVGVLQIAAKDPGSVTSIKVKVGDRVQVGQVIALLDQSRVQDQLSSAQHKLKVLQTYIGDIENLQPRDKEKRKEFQQ